MLFQDCLALFCHSRQRERSANVNVEQPPEHQSRTLVAEDNPDYQDLLMLILEDLGFMNVTTVNDGQAFLEK